MSDTVWAITRGEYSDYGVVACFEDQATAETFLAAMREGHRQETPDDLTVTIFPYFAAESQPRWSITWHARWTQETQQIETFSHREIHGIGDEPPRRPEVNVYGTRTIHVRGASEESVRKAAADRLARLQAEAAGIADP